MGTRRSARVLRLRETTTPPESVPSATSCLTAFSPGTSRTTTAGGSWLACTAAFKRAGVVPETPMVVVPENRLPAKANPKMAAMATGATRQVMTAERSRTRRRSSLRVMMPISRRAPGAVGVARRST